MLHKRPSIVADGEIIKEGTLLKSPPPSIGKRWRKRFFVLRKCLGETYTLSYYSQDRLSEEQKGSINISKISKVEKGSDCPREELASTLKSCRCSPGQVLVIRTKKRTYFLVTEEPEEEIDSWQKCLSHILEGRETRFITDNIIRPNSYPSDHPKSGTMMEQEAQRQRSRTSPSVPTASYLPNDFNSIFYTPPSHPPAGGVLNEGPQSGRSPQTFIVEENGEPVCFCPCAQHQTSRRESVPLPDYDSDIGSDDEPVYQVPRNIQQRLSSHSDSSDPQEISDTDPDLEDVYEPMYPIAQHNTRSEEKLQDEALVPGEPMRVESRELRQMDLLKIKYKRVGTDELQNKEVTVPTEHLQKYLDVEELGESLYICRWNGPSEIGCLFRRRDQIDIVNEFRVKRRDVFLQMLNNSVQSTVKLVIISDPSASVFHADNCHCGAS